MAEHDFIVARGAAFLAHRLKRASDLLVDGAGDWLAQSGMTAPPRALSTLLLLKAEGRLPVTGISERLRLSHPLMIKLLKVLEDLGLVAVTRDRKDARRRMIRLTKRGQAESEIAERAIAVLAQAYADLFAETGVDLLDAVARLEAACAETSFADRLAAADRRDHVPPLGVPETS
jgi:DNA-binding MarR family transcriptional regulator